MSRKIKKNSGIIEVVIIVSLAALLGLGVYLYSQNHFQIQNTTPGTLSPQPSPAGKQASAVLSEAKVEITSQGFLPATVSVRAGTMVTWTNLDSRPHQVAFDTTVLPDSTSDLLETNDSFTFTFEKPGVFSYHDGQNPLRNRGVLIVK